MVFIRPVIINDDVRAKSETARSYNYVRNQQIQVLTGRQLQNDDMPVLPHLYPPKPVALPAPVETH